MFEELYGGKISLLDYAYTLLLIGVVFVVPVLVDRLYIRLYNPRRDGKIVFKYDVSHVIFKGVWLMGWGTYGLYHYFSFEFPKLELFSAIIGTFIVVLFGVGMVISGIGVFRNSGDQIEFSNEGVLIKGDVSETTTYRRGEVRSMIVDVEKKTLIVNDKVFSLGEMNLEPFAAKMHVEATKYYSSRNDSGD